MISSLFLAAQLATVPTAGIPHRLEAAGLEVVGVATEDAGTDTLLRVGVRLDGGAGVDRQISVVSRHCRPLEPLEISTVPPRKPQGPSRPAFRVAYRISAEDAPFEVRLSDGTRLDVPGVTSPNGCEEPEERARRSTSGPAKITVVTLGQDLGLERLARSIQRGQDRNWVPRNYYDPYHAPPPKPPPPPRVSREPRRDVIIDFD
jgi:hypothetical protein